MPMIGWDNLELPIGGFALYWIVSVLLTIVVLSAWALWMRLNERRHGDRMDRSEKAAAL